ncbi:MAG: right-handed parallel beta-helix repeat-containing protein [Candidatus Brocadiia bacterium]
MSCVSGPARAFTVSREGRAGGDGSPASPFLTLEQARDAIQALKKQGPLPKGGVVVELRGGAYPRSQALELKAEDSGTAEAPIVYRARPGEEVRLAGGREVTRWEKVTAPAVLERLPQEARGHVLQTDLAAQGIRDYGKLTRRGFGQPMRPAHMELFFDDQPMTLARWPNQGYARIAGLPKGKAARVFAYSGDRPQRWTDEPNAWLYGYWYHDWADTYIAVEAIDPKARTITMAGQHRYGLRKGNRWRVLNVLAELDAPGEYYVDRQKGILYFWPPAPIEEGRAVVSVAEGILRLEDVRHVTFRGFVIEACRGTAVRIDGGSHNQLVGCILRNIGNRAVSVSGSENSVIGCDVYHTGDGGIGLYGGDRKTLSHAKLLAENNHIHHYSRWCHTYRPAVAVGGCGNRVRRNLIHHGPHNAIQLGGNEHLIEFNEIHSVCTDTGDVGAFYMGRDWTARGTIIRCNYWHHIQGPGRLGAMGVYLDDQASGITITGNIFYKVTRAAFIGGGRDNVVENNIFVDCRPALHIDARGMGWRKKQTDNPKGTLRTRLRAMPIDGELWRRRYPNLPDILDDEPNAPKRNTIVRNICVGGQWEEIEPKARKYQTIEDNLVDADPQFVAPEKLDFRLKPTSPAFDLGFKPIPVDQIGLYEDPRRASWPVRHEPRELPQPKAARRPEPRTGPPPVYIVARSAASIDIDGRLAEDEWRGVKPVVLEEDFHGERSPRTSRAWLRHDGTRLYVAFDNTVLARPKLKTGHQWGENDACEVALRDVAGGKDAPLLVYRGYLDGTFEVTDEPGTPAQAIARAEKAVAYAARVASPTRWTAEWSIPFASLGVEPARHDTLAANLSVRKTADELWLQWRSTRGHTFAVDRAGILKLGD